MSNVSNQSKDNVVTWQELHALAEMGLSFKAFERKVGREMALRWLKRKISESGK